MRLFSFLAFLVALGTGIFILYLLSRYTLDRRSGFIRSFLRNVLFFNLLIIAGLFFNIIDWFLINDLSPHSYLWSQTGILISLTILKFLWLYSFLEMNRCIIDLSLSKRFKRIYIYVCGFFTVLLTTAFVNVDNPFRFMLTRFLLVFIETVIIASAFGAILKLLKSEVRQEKNNRNKGILLFSGLYLILFSIILVSLTLGLFVDREHADMYTLVNAFTMIFYNFLPLIWLRRFGGLLGKNEILGKDFDLSKDVFDRFRISAREREIIQLICQGKSNREIARDLFITQQTVKDHNKNIFRKTGVKNRVQLVNLFRVFDYSGHDLEI